jgi:cytochrome b6-f complex iron-sulfur subunit
MTATASQPQTPAGKTDSVPGVPAMTRREFLYYIWAASMAILTAQAGGAVVWFAYPRFKAGEFGGIFELDISQVPAPDSGPKGYDAGRFWLVNLGDEDVNDQRLKDYVGGQPYATQSKGVKALYKICVHLGCLYKWVPTNNRFECPCHGSKYLTTGVRIGGPARRNLDVFVVTVLDSSGNTLRETEVSADGEGLAVDITGAAKLVINTGKRYNGAFNDVAGVA